MRALAVDGRLEAIAGPPLASRTTAGTTTGLTIPDAAPRTIYGVVNKTGTPVGTYTIAATHHGATSNRLALLTNQTNGQGALVQIAGVNTFTAFPPVGISRHAACAVYTPSTGQGVMHDELSSRTATVTPANMPSDRLFVSGPIAECSTDYASVFVEEHSIGTRRRILGWLSRRYGTPPPA